MIENRPWLTVVSHLVLILGIAVVALPLYVTFVASTLSAEEVLQAPMPLVPGSHLVENYRQVLTSGSENALRCARRAHDAQQPRHRPGDRGRQDRDLDAVGVRGRVLPLPVPGARSSG